MNSNYNNEKNYKIIDNTSDMIYIGSTCMTLEQRLKYHKVNYKGFKKGIQNNTTSFKILENNNYKIKLVKNYPCNNKQELNLEEGKIIKQLKNDGLNIINKCIAGQIHKDSVFQYYQNNKDKINETHKEYNKNNKDKINQYLKEYRQINKDKIKEKAKQKMLMWQYMS